MKITCNQKDLFAGINAVSRACGKSTEHPIIENIHLSAKEGKLNLEATNLSLTVQTNVPAMIEGDLTKSIAVSARGFGEMIRSMPNANIEMELVDNSLVVKHKNSEYHIACVEGDSFPSAPEVQSIFKFEVKSDDLRKAIQNTIFSVYQGEERPILTGELFEIQDGKLNVVAVDGFRISVRTMDVVLKEGVGSSVVIPGKTLEEIQKLATEDPIQFIVGEKNVKCCIGETVIISRLLEGEFLKYQQVFEQAQVTAAVTVDKKEFLEAITRTTLITEGAKKNATKMSVQSFGIELTSKGNLGSGKEKVEGSLKGTAIDVAVNPKYLMDVLRTIESNTVEIAYTSAVGPILVLGEDYKYLVLPIRQTEN